MFEMFDNPVDKLQSIIDNTKPKYKCIVAYETINVDDIVTVAIKPSQLHNAICVTHNRYNYFIQSHTLDKCFKLI